MVEDQVTDASLIQRQIHKCVEDCDVRLVDSILNFKHALKTFVPDFILTDYQLVGFTAMDVIEELNLIDKSIPVIIITGTLNNEELVANTVLNGASAFLLKENISNLHNKLLPIFETLISEKVVELSVLERKRVEREKLEEIHTLLRQASKVEENDDDSIKSYYKKILDNIDTNIKSLLN